MPEKRLDFSDVLGLTKKTLTQRVYCNSEGLGEIKWYAPWRRYCFFPIPQVLFDASCLGEIVEHLNELMQQRKEDNA